MANTMLATLTSTCNNLLNQQQVCGGIRSEDPSGNRPGSTHPHMPEDPVSTGNRLSKRPLTDSPNTADAQQCISTEAAIVACKKKHKIQDIPPQSQDVLSLFPSDSEFTDEEGARDAGLVSDEGQE